MHSASETPQRMFHNHRFISQPILRRPNAAASAAIPASNATMPLDPDFRFSLTLARVVSLHMLILPVFHSSIVTEWSLKETRFCSGLKPPLICLAVVCGCN
jgi:hypothetical protein